MPFADSFRKVTIKQGVLSAECRKADGKTWISSSINVDEFLGNVDGKFILGGKGFSQSAQDITLVDGILSAKLKNSAGKYVDAKYDLSSHVHSQDGIIAAHGDLSVIGVAAAGSLDRTFSASSGVSAASMATSMSSSSSVATSMTSVSKSSSTSTKTFKSAAFRQFSQQLLIEEHCTNFVLKGTFLHCDIHHDDGRVTHVSFDLDVCIGNVNGALVWDASGFSKSCTSIALEGYFLTAKCRHPVQADQYLVSRIDLRTRLRVQGDVLIFIETNKKLSMMLSEVPWMKFKVIAEPDLSVFSKHPVVQQTMTRIAESTVEHVTTEMHRMLTIAMEEAIVAITASAMKHVSEQMTLTVEEAANYAVASPSATEAEFLRIGAAAGFYGGAYGAGYGGAYGAGAAYGNAGALVSPNGYQAGGFQGAIQAGGYQAGSYQAGLIQAGGYQAGGFQGGYFNGTSGAGVLSRSVSESSSISTSSASQAHSESSSVASSTATKTASATAITASS
ncbi:CNVH-domain-containing protein [Pholiota conissans]|uniref:CNVH-domain-containing protein n=1 Tax=Pholiota conissans TaxID=109636 RepID=A0A9P6D6W4_9AGAR|nr:CNVH-domain-containing protein [Pholiota conissans]